MADDTSAIKVDTGSVNSELGSINSGSRKPGEQNAEYGSRQ